MGDQVDTVDPTTGRVDVDLMAKGTEHTKTAGR
jgi:hypothetical protein